MDVAQHNITLNDFQSICRLCIKKERSLKPIFKSESEHNIDNGGGDHQNGIMTLNTMILECFGLNVVINSFKIYFHEFSYMFFDHQVHPDDGLPLLICSTCSLKLTEGYIFREQCIASAEILLSLRNEPKPEQYFPEIVYVRDNFD